MRHLAPIALLLVLGAVGYVALTGQQAKRLNNQAVRLISQGQYAEAAAVLERARAAEPKNATVLKNLGWAYDELGQMDKAAEAYQAALAVSPQLSDARMRLQEIESTTKSLGERAAQRIARMKAEGWNDDDATLDRTLKMAEVEANMSNYKQAIILFERALFKNPGDLEIEMRIEALEEKVAKGEL